MPVSDPRFGKLLLCECAAPDRAARLQKICGLTPIEQMTRLDDIIEAGPGTAAMLSAARSFLSKPFGFLTLWGHVGTAKTLLLQAIVNESVQRNMTAIYCPMFNLVSYVRDAFNDGEGTSAYRRLVQFADAEVLAIDEVDKLRVSDWTLELETALFDQRYRGGLARKSGTILAMNSDPKLLPEWIYSRLSDGRNQIVQNQDPDLRPLMK